MGSRLKDFKGFLNEENDNQATVEEPKSATPDFDIDVPKSDQKEGHDDKYKVIKDDLTKMIQETGDFDKILAKVGDESIENLNIKGLIQESDIYDFYLAHEFIIDETLNALEFFENKPSSYGIDGLYNAVIVGTQMAVQKILEDMKNK